MQAGRLQALSCSAARQPAGTAWIEPKTSAVWAEPKTSPKTRVVFPNPRLCQYFTGRSAPCASGTHQHSSGALSAADPGARAAPSSTPPHPAHQQQAAAAGKQAAATARQSLSLPGSAVLFIGPVCQAVQGCLQRPYAIRPGADWPASSPAAQRCKGQPSTTQSSPAQPRSPDAQPNAAQKPRSPATSPPNRGQRQGKGCRGSSSSSKGYACSARCSTISLLEQQQQGACMQYPAQYPLRCSGSSKGHAVPSPTCSSSSSRLALRWLREATWSTCSREGVGGGTRAAGWGGGGGQARQVLGETLHQG